MPSQLINNGFAKKLSEGVNLLSFCNKFDSAAYRQSNLVERIMATL